MELTPESEELVITHTHTRKKGKIKKKINKIKSCLQDYQLNYQFRGKIRFKRKARIARIRKPTRHTQSYGVIVTGQKTLFTFCQEKWEPADKPNVGYWVAISHGRNHATCGRSVSSPICQMINQMGPCKRYIWIISRVGLPPPLFPVLYIMLRFIHKTHTHDHTSLSHSTSTPHLTCILNIC